MSEIKNDLVVEIHYTLKDEKGNVIDSSEGKAPLIYIHGKNNIIPGLESELTGKKVSDKLNVQVTPENAYGEYNDALIQKVPKSEFENVDDLKVGVQFQVGDPQGQMFIATVTEVSETEVTLNANHPLAGMTLTFDVEVISIREATEEELAHGHVHAKGESCDH
jgi:FKBP-type peptidyl-prolyl cis-trans isomerase SlyD